MRITFSGHAEADVAPERGTVHLSVAAQNLDQQAALREAENAANALLTDLKPLREGPVTWYAMDAIATSSWQPRDQHGRAQARQYRAHCRAQVKFKDFFAVSAAVSRWGEQPSISVGHVAWELTDTTRERVEADVLVAALADAHQRASIAAGYLGQPNLRVIEVADPGLLGSGQEVGPPTPMAFARGAAVSESGQGVELSPQEITISTTLHVQFETA